MSKKTKLILSLFVGMVVSAVFLGLLFVGSSSKGHSFSAIWAQMIWWPALAATALYLLGHWLRGIRCAWILRPYQPLSTWKATQLVWIGYAANNVLPARLGEFVRASILTSREHVAYGISLSTLLIERILDGLAIVGILWLVSAFVPHHPFLSNLSWVAGGIFVGALLVVLLARLWESMFTRLLAFACGLLPAGIGSRIEGFGLRILEGTHCLQWDRRLPGILGMSVLIWAVEGGMFLLMLLAFQLPLSWIAAYLAMTITNLGVLVPSTPSNMGTFHFFCTKGLIISGIISAVPMGLSYAVAIHLLQVVPVTLLGMWSLSTYGFDLRTLWNDVTSVKDESDSAEPLGTNHLESTEPATASSQV
jgi:uncharacterized protein (TIRG00374 family)